MKENVIICGDWHKCYDDSWKGIIVPEAFAHPAKMVRGLTNRIFKHALSESWVKPGDVVVDPFGGIGSTGIVGASLGLRVVCVELEEQFRRLAGSYDCPGIKKQEWIRWYNRFGRNKEICPNCQTVAQNWYDNDYKIPNKQPHHFVGNFELNRKAFNVSHFGHAYQPRIIQGDSRKLSEVIAGADCVISSPPYAETMNSEKSGIDWSKIKREDGSPRDMSKEPGQKTRIGAGAEMRYGTSKGNLGNLKPGEVEAIISSPPFEESLPSGDTSSSFKAKYPDSQTGGDWGQSYGSAAGNIGNDKGETFWQAARQIVSECHQILKPGGHAIWVVKAFVRKGAIVDFPGDWRRLCEAQGFTTVHEHHAMLVKETKHNGLFEEITETKERKSFFRRLAEKKGSPKIDYEVVLCTQKTVER